jgi:hypothetical protein
MSNVAQNPATQTEAEAKQKAFHAQCEAEVKSYSESRLASRQAGVKLGFGSLIILAQALGASADKKGLPSESAADNFFGAMKGRKLSYEQRAEIARKANAEVPEGHKPVAVITAKANDQRGAQAYRFNTSALTAEALG